MKPDAPPAVRPAARAPAGARCGPVPRARAPVVLLLITAMLGTVLALTAAQTNPDRDPPLPNEGKDASPQAPSAIASRWVPGSESGPDVSGYDALQVDLSTEIFFASESIAGRASWTLRLDPTPPEAIVFDLFANMIVSRVTLDGEEIAWQHGADTLTCIPTRPLLPGQKLTLAIDYSGRPARGFLLGFEFGEQAGRPIAYTNCEPVAARTWWPCKDRPDEKFFADLRFIVPAGITAASNGTLAGVDSLSGERVRWHWSERHPIAAYLVSVVATEFAAFADEYVALDGRRMPLLYYAFPEDLERAREQWAVTPRALAFMAETFGEYPFVLEKYGMAEFPWSGAMEHQTLTSMGAYFLQLGTSQDWVVVHELAHQWWGDWVTCATWRDIWLNEGFAVYTEALWAEHLAGPDSLRAQMRANDRREFAGSVYDPDFIFNATVYRKGAWVLHMLRHVAGDQRFFRALRAYGSAHAFGTAVTEDLREAFARETGDDLRWFFDPWVYGEGRPLYGVWWEDAGLKPNGRTLVRVRIVQESTGPQTFAMPLDALFLLEGGGEYRTVLRDSLPEQEFWLTTPAPPESLILDPDGWVLCRIYYGEVPSAVDDEGSRPDPSSPVRLSLGRPHPNPSAGRVFIPVEIAGLPQDARLSAERDSRALARALGTARLGVYDSAGRLLRRLDLRVAAGGAGADWDGLDDLGRPAPSGIYFVRLRESSPSGASQTARGARLLLVR